jgi:hypothetical protein
VSFILLKNKINNNPPIGGKLKLVKVAYVILGKMINKCFFYFKGKNIGEEV